jgi:protein TonB
VLAKYQIILTINYIIMNTKKNPNADLERKRFAFLQIGLIIAGGLTLMAFQYTNASFSSLKKETVIDVACQLPSEIPIETVYKIPQKKHHHVKMPIIDEVKQVNKIVKSDPTPQKKEIIEIIDVVDTGDEPGIITGIDLDSTFEVVEEMPEFPGGYNAMNKFIGENIKVPEYAMPLEGKVYVRFVVDTDGSIKNVRILKGMHRDYDNAAVKVVSKMPKWKPGKQAGKAVKVQYEIPIRFRR